MEVGTSLYTYYRRKKGNAFVIQSCPASADMNDASIKDITIKQQVPV